ncbi:MAG: ferritin-like domain-containing protein [Fervidobacterium sp.]|uniref:ferritin-like domain-containing protein n=1 Tax=Fervidobacterium sp. TaxID=1871331 RepID=UPI00404A003A
MYDILKLAEQFEIEGYKFYTAKREEVKNKQVSDIFDYLAQMEKEHTEFIRRLIKTLEEGREVESIEMQDSSYFKSRYEGQKIQETSPEDDIADLAVLRMAYLIEKDFMEFYKKAAENEKNESVKKVLVLLQDWEEGHKKIIEEQMKAIIERNNLELGFYPF